MRPAPVGVTLLVSADQDAKVDAGLAIALLAEPVEADYLGLDRILRLRRCRDDRRRAGNGDRDQRRGYQWLQAHLVSFLFSPAETYGQESECNLNWPRKSGNVSIDGPASVVAAI
jgi:hypothetical protein